MGGAKGKAKPYCITRIEVLEAGSTCKGRVGEARKPRSDSGCLWCVSFCVLRAFCCLGLRCPPRGEARECLCVWCRSRSLWKGCRRRGGQAPLAGEPQTANHHDRQPGSFLF